MKCSSQYLIKAGKMPAVRMTGFQPALSLNRTAMRFGHCFYG
jgi:hypothetical protein